MLRHTALFLHRDDTTPEQALNMCKGLAFMRFECDSVRALDYGTDLFGGSQVLRDVKPWCRTPLWRAERTGPVANYDTALHLDFDDAAGLAAYDDHPAHHDVADYNAAVSFGEFTARVDYWYEGPPLIQRGLIRHTALFLWQETADQAARQVATDAVRALEDFPGVSRVTIGENVGKLTTDYDWIMDVQLNDTESARSLLESKAYSALTERLADVTRFEWTARLTHRMRGI
jgi:hypothetical protein